MNKGILITLEGIDGSGKSSAVGSLYEALSSEYEVILTREPGATELGQQLRTILQKRTFDLDAKAEYLLFAADRAQHMSQVVLPALQRGKIVLSDRMADSSLAYQGYARGVDPAMISRVNSWAMQERVPDLTLYLMIDYEEAAKRLQERNEQVTVFEQEQQQFFEKVQIGFEQAFKGRSVVRIDASQTKERVQQQVYTAVKEFLVTRGFYETTTSTVVDRP